ncbi:MAG TPA: hypothetical protein PLT26_09475 [Anaerolineaceae bacterium]|nr:hypothetical protein [Anaerolineaceae bacterium]
MSFSLESWKTEIAHYFNAQAAHLQPAGVDTLYGWLILKALMPAVIATQLRDPEVTPVVTRLLKKTSAGPILALLQRWPARSEAELAREIAAAARADAHLRRALDTLLQKLDVFALARQALPEAEQARFTETLEAELKALGSRLDSRTGAPPAANPLDRQRRAPRPKRISPLLIGLSAATALLLITALLGWGRASRTARELEAAQTSLAVAESTAAAAETARAQADTRAADADAGRAAALAQANQAMALQLAVQAEDLFEDQPGQLELTTLLALEAVQRDPTSPANATAMAAAALLPVEDYQITSSSAVIDLAIRPDGSQAAALSEDGAIQVWDLKTGAVILNLHQKSPVSIRYSPNGRWLLGITDDYGSTVWDAESGEVMVQNLLGGEIFFSPDSRYITVIIFNWLDTLETYSYEIATGQRIGLSYSFDAYYSYQTSPDGQWLLGYKQGYYRRIDFDLWNLTTQQRVTSIEDASLALYPRFSANSQRLVYYTKSSRIVAIDLESGQAGESANTYSGVYNLLVSSDDSLIAAARENGTIVILSETQWKDPLGTQSFYYDWFTTIEQDGTFRTLAFSPDNRWLAAGSADGSVRILDIATGREIARLNHAGPVSRVAFSPDGQQIITAGQDGAVRVWQVASGPDFWLPMISLPEDVYIQSVAFNPEEQQVLALTSDGKVFVWDEIQKTMRLKLNANNPYSGGFGGFSASYKLIVLTGYRAVGQINIWDITTGENLLNKPFGHFATVLAFSPDERLIAVGTKGGYVQVEEITSSKTLANIKHGSTILAISFSPDGQRLVVGGSDGSLKIWELSTRQVLEQFSQDASILSLAYSADGQRIYSASQAGEVCVWEAATGIALACQTIPQPDLAAIIFSPDGRQAATRAASGTLQVWDLFTGPAAVLRASLPDSQGVALTFSPDGRRVAYGTDDNLVHIWPWQPQDLTDAVCARLNRNLTLEEWETYFLPSVPYHQTCPNLPPGDGAEEN